MPWPQAKGGGREVVVVQTFYSKTFQSGLLGGNFDLPLRHAHHPELSLHEMGCLMR